MPNHAEELFNKLERGMVLEVPRPGQERYPIEERGRFYVAILAAVGEVIVITYPAESPEALNTDRHIYLMWSVRHQGFVHVKYHILNWDYKQVRILPERRHDLVAEFDALHIAIKTNWVDILGLPPHTGSNIVSA